MSVRGFTLIELLISIAIITIITAIVVVRYKQFDSTVLLKGTAYEVALAIRDAQVQSVSATRTTGGLFKRPFGVTFTPGQNTYTRFEFNSAVIDDFPKYDGISSNDIQAVTLDRGMTISDVCVTVGATETCKATIARLDISFQRPEYKALFYADQGGSKFPGSIDSVKIKLSSTANPANVFVVEVSQLGQISVSKQ